MTDPRNPFAPAPSFSETPADPQPAQPSEPSAADPAPTPADLSAPTVPSTAILKFKSCRWRCDPEAGEYCTHRDVLPFAGKEGFVPESWCPDCAFYKLRRTPKKRDYSDNY
jgi:hypothetical protein